jgi:hypothetical protein
MPTWGEILVELHQSAIARGGNPDLDGVRRRYLAQLHQLTGRETILYATDWLAAGGPMSSITLEDMQGMMEVCKDLKGPGLDLILHSPGGSGEATASLVNYLRSRFAEIRVFIPLAAMSAGTMWALAGDVIVMGKHSQLGPIDPQVFRPAEQRYVPARAIIDQFERAKRECADDPRQLGAWMPILQQYGTSLIEECEKAEELGRNLVTAWLARWMLKNERDPNAKARQIATYFADYSIHRSHALGIDRETARAGLKIDNLEDDPSLQDAVLSVHHAAMHTFAGPAGKLVENHLGRAFVKIAQQVAIPALQIPQG